MKLIKSLAELEVAIAQGKPIQVKLIGLSKVWADISEQGIMNLSVAGLLAFIDKGDIRIKEERLSIHGVGGEYYYPAPEKDEHGVVGKTYYIPHLSANNSVVETLWEGLHEDWRNLRRGMVHTTRAAAREHQEAIILAMGGVL